MLQADGRVVRTVRVDERTAAATFRSLMESARASDLILVSANIFPREYVGIEVQGGFSRFVGEMVESGRPVIAVSFGTPYLLSSIPSVSTYLLAWSSTAESQRAVARALTGRAQIRGRLPVTLSDKDRAGAGIQRAVLR
jgi:beta-N-acetylhexosaminidase